MTMRTAEQGVPRRAGGARHGAHDPRPVWRWVVLGVVALLLAVALWIVVRGLIARDQLLGAMPLVAQLKAQIVEGGTDGFDPLADEIAVRADTAAALTSDPLWRAVEIVPGIGPNLVAFREAAGAVQTITRDALPPLVALSGELDLAKFVPQGGAIDIAPIQALQPALAEAGAAVTRAAEQVAAIDPSGTIPQIGGAVEQLADVVREAAGLVAGANGLVQVLPGMLGADGPRTTVLLVQNNAELRATGGIPGAAIELRTDQGRVEFGAQVSGAVMGQFEAAVLPLTDAEGQLYGSEFGVFLQNATVTPDFARSGQIVQAMWQQRFGIAVDAVVSIDPVVLSYLLEATGPLALLDGTVLDASNATQLLLNEVYFRYEDPVEQDAFFGVAAQRVFDAVMHYSGDPKAFIGAIGRGVADHRIYAWSAHPEEQAVIASPGSSLASLLPTSDAMATGFGVYLADLTMSKIDWYLQPSLEVAGVGCPEWGGHPYYEVRLRIESTMPPGGEGVPDYVVGPDTSRDVRGTALTRAFLVMPAGFKVFQTLVDETNTGIQVVDPGDGTIRYAVNLEQAPGATTEVLFRVWGDVGAPTKVRLVHTPTAGEFPTAIGGMLACPAEDSVPTGDDGGVIALGTAAAAAPGLDSALAAE
ncbi:MAG: DUF4012 domain-containing protein [Microbacteriaceae bacterium]|nr:DUF4012 domain-containing protein [Microbacteriaceae bacterium]